MKTILDKARRLHASQQISYSWDEVEALINRDPILFERCLNRAEKREYLRNSPGSENYVLWIACNLARCVHDPHTRCYYCARTFSIEDFFNGWLSLDHFTPRSKGGSHSPLNTVPACKNCNKTKADLSDKDFERILFEPEGYFQDFPMSKSKRSKLQEFAEMYFPKIRGHNEYAKRNGIGSIWRPHWEERARQYRLKWGIDSK
jgi:5-methylcytosine-specific restriction endonuclease McrA